MLQLGVNIDHVATLRQARYSGMLEAHNCEPDLVEAALACERAGAVGITVHLRGDRRHLQDRDLPLLRRAIGTKLNLEMGNSPEILAIALATKPEDVCLVPENREEITTEGGLDAVSQFTALTPTVATLRAAGVRVSLFIEPDAAQIDAAARLGAEVVELHTGAFANAEGEAQLLELERIRAAAVIAHEKGLVVNAGHGINYSNIRLIREVAHLEELNIGHSIICRAVFHGLETAVAQMHQLMRGGE